MRWTEEERLMYQIGIKQDNKISSAGKIVIKKKY